jgi:hypothetical protein
MLRGMDSFIGYCYYCLLLFKHNTFRSMLSSVDIPGRIVLLGLKTYVKSFRVAYILCARKDKSRMHRGRQAAAIIPIEMLFSDINGRFYLPVNWKSSSYSSYYSALNVSVFVVLSFVSKEGQNLLRGNDSFDGGFEFSFGIESFEFGQIDA